jgi:rhamnogalacturonan endolyase
MKTLLKNALTWLALVLICASASHAACQQLPVRLTEDAETATLSNGLVTLIVKKANGNILSLKYQGSEIMGHGGGYWVMLAAVPGQPTTQVVGMPSVFSITKDPARNNGSVAEIALRFPYTRQAATIPMDIELRYTLHQGDSAIYGWTIVDHDAKYPPVDIEVSVVTLKLNPQVFDFLSIDSARQKLMPTPQEWVNGTQANLKEARMINTGPNAGQVEHKYDYNTLTWCTPAYGWSSTKKNIGVFIVNPSIEYLNGPPVQVDYEGHIDVKPTLPADPTLLFNWHSSHYGGKKIQVNANEHWRKIVGPFLIYCNQGSNTHAMWQNALVRAVIEQKAWPYAWADVQGYAHTNERGGVTGHLEVHDQQAPKASAAGAWVGLAEKPYEISLKTGPVKIDWQLDGKHYGYWVQADALGRFFIPNARPGTYMLYAFNNGILGDYSKADVHIEAGKTIDIGKLKWVPVRNGKQLWDIGIPNRSAEEFRHGDHYWQWGLYNLYPQEFPDDVDFVIGKSDYHRDWNYVQPPKPDGNGTYGNTTWKIEFNMDKPVKGTSTLRLAICGARGGAVDVKLNGQPLGTTGYLLESGVMHRDGIRAAFLLMRDFQFDAALFKPGNNIIELTKHARDWPDGVLYDYIRLELDDKKPFIKP